MNKPIKNRVGDFLAGKGFYIVLFLCIAAIGISGYYLFSSVNGDGDTAVAAPTEVMVEASPEHSVPPTTNATQTVTPSTAKPNTATKQETLATAEPTAKVETDPTFCFPIQGEVVNTFSMDTLSYDETMKDWRTHAGIDIAAAIGTEVRAAAGGEVVEVDTDDFLGTRVVIAHSNGLRTVYANLAASPNVSAGDQVAMGDIIGSVGQTAISESAEAPHLHLEMTRDGVLVNPLDLLPAQ
ncbi:MAG: M23 family metallopeptidase [Oscillospiraceae bacterium]|nr:M23 family metallopeptidase [Oscillospiraceae bacterium]